MKHLWTYIEKQRWSAATKYRVALLLLGAQYALAGFTAWLIISFRALSTWDWMVCFIGYPVVLSWFVVFFYSCRHDFHDGRGRRRPT